MPTSTKPSCTTYISSPKPIIANHATGSQASLPKRSSSGSSAADSRRLPPSGSCDLGSVRTILIRYQTP